MIGLNGIKFNDFNISYHNFNYYNNHQIEMEEYTKLVLGSLLHDIGKVIQRTVGKVEGHHSASGYDFLNSIEKEISLFAKYHRKELTEELRNRSDIDNRTKNLLWIVYEADNLSSKEGKETEDNFNPGTPLISVFSSVNFNKKEIKKKAYPLTTLDFEKFVFPGYERDGAEDRIKHKNYGDFFADFKQEIPDLYPDLILSFLERETTFIPARTGEDEDVSLFDHLKTTCAIASCLYLYHKNELDKYVEEDIKNRTENKYLLVCGGISGIQKFVYNITSKGGLRLLRARSFLLEMISQDVVQELLERLNLTRANLLYCAGGDFFVLAPNIEENRKKVDDLKKELNRKLLEKFEGDIYYTLNYTEFKGEDFYNFWDIWNRVYEKISDEKSKKFQDVLIETPEEVLMEKDHRDKTIKCEACKKYVNTEYIRKVDKGDEVLEYCKDCVELLNVGGKLVVAGNRYILRFKNRDNFDLELPFSKIKITDRIENDVDTVFYINSFEPPKEIFSLKKQKDFTFVTLPLGNYIYETCDLDELSKKSTGAKKIGVLRMDVDNLGKIFKEGLQKDKKTISRVTNLSRFLDYFFKVYINLLGEFKEKNILGITNKIWEHDGKIQRINKRYLFSWDNVPGSDSERFVDYLVKDLNMGWAKNAEINKIDNGTIITVTKDENSLEIKLNETEDKVILKTRSGETHEYISKKENGKLNIYNKRSSRQFAIVYAGGDDLFIVGSWDDVLESAFDINALFRKYVGENEGITISAGFCIFDKRFPFYKIAELSGEKEKTAKDENKNRIWLFDRGIKFKKDSLKESVEWNKFLEVWKDFALLIDGDRLKVSKGCIGKLSAINEDYKENPDRVGWALQISYWYGGLDKKDKEIFKHIINKYSIIKRTHPLNIYDIDIPLRIINLTTRNKGGK